MVVTVDLSLFDLSAGCGLSFDTTHPDGSVVYRLLLAIAQPMRAVFLDGNRRQSAPSQSLYDLPPGVSPHILACGNYQYDGLRCVDHTQVPWKSLSDIWVLPEIHSQDSNVHAPAEPVAWTIFVRFGGTAVISSEPQSGQHRRSRGPVDEQILS